MACEGNKICKQILLWNSGVHVWEAGNWSWLLFSHMSLKLHKSKWFRCVVEESHCKLITQICFYTDLPVLLNTGGPNAIPKQFLRIILNKWYLIFCFEFALNTYFWRSHRERKCISLVYARWQNFRRKHVWLCDRRCAPHIGLKVQLWGNPYIYSTSTGIWRNAITFPISHCLIRF